MKLVLPVFMVLYLNAYVHALSQSLVEEMTEKMKMYGLECAETENVSSDDLTALIQKQVPKTHEGKCVILCTAKKLNIMRDDGSIGEGDVEWLARVKIDDPDVYDKMINTHKKCIADTVDNEDLCEKATRLTICIFIESKKNGLDKYL
ncbi:general odorant-binding protein 19d-like [Euwallacea similis]|uniref:general odorant-binding protein 19d-like n=1 Tax=Euwallacea similis TaxID=1736056 RepID=UPI00344F124C